MHTESGGGVSDSAAFAQELGELKQEGSNILLVGEGERRAHSSACRRLLGDYKRGQRYRLFVVTTGSGCSSLHDYGYDEDGERTRIVRQRENAASTPNREGEAIVGTKLLSALGTSVIETVDEFDEEADGLDPSELRVCVDSLAPLLSAHSAENVFRFVHVLTTRIRQVNGMGHHHLPVDRHHDAVRLLEPMFDAVVEVRTAERSVEQRWHLRDGKTSEWLSL